MSKKSNAGRKTVMTETTLNKLKEAFLMGCTDNEACLFAEIDPQTLYNYQKDNPDYSSKKAVWKDNPILLARRTVVRGVQGDKDLALRFLERKKKDEFSLRTEHTGADGKDLIPTPIYGGKSTE